MSLYVARSSAIAARVLDGEMIVMSARDSSLFTLNEVATAIWNAADGRTTIEEIVRERVCTGFEVGNEEALADAEAFCRDLAQHGILIISGQPIEAASTTARK
jgi:hypothetical protein